MENKELLLKILEELQKLNENLEKINKREEENYMPLKKVGKNSFQL